MIELGDKVKDPISGIKGTVTARTEYLYGCVRVLVEWAKDGTGHELWLDETRVQANEKTPKRALTGGGGANPSRRSGE